MGDSLPPRIDPTSPGVIIGGLIAFAIILFAVPPLLFLLPIVLIGLTVLYLFGQGKLRKARRLAQRHLGGPSTLKVELSPGLSGALVMNDWGVVCAQPRQRAVELAWSEIAWVDEPEIAVLRFFDARSERCRVDLSQEKYFLAIAAISSKIPGRVDFLVDPATGRSAVLRRVERGPLEWKGPWGRFAIGKYGVEYGSTQLQWHDILRAHEVMFAGDETNSHWELTITGRSFACTLRSNWFDDGRQFGNSGYDLIKSILNEQIPNCISFYRPAPTPRERAIEEFKRGQELLDSILELSLKKKRPGFFEEHCGHMMRLMDMYSLEYAVDANRFFRDYADLLVAMNRTAEAAAVRSRMRP